MSTPRSFNRRASPLGNFAAPSESRESIKPFILEHWQDTERIARMYQISENVVDHEEFVLFWESHFPTIEKDMSTRIYNEIVALTNRGLSLAEDVRAFTQKHPRVMRYTATKNDPSNVSFDATLNDTTSASPLESGFRTLFTRMHNECARFEVNVAQFRRQLSLCERREDAERQREIAVLKSREARMREKMDVYASGLKELRSQVEQLRRNPSSSERIHDLEQLEMVLNDVTYDAVHVSIPPSPFDEKEAESDDSPPKHFEDDYTVGQKLGEEGCFGVVYECYANEDRDHHHQKNDVFAVKLIPHPTIKHEMVEDMIIADAKHEMQILSSLDHRFIVAFHDFYENASGSHIVMEKCCGRSLIDDIIETGPYPEERAASIMTMLLQAVEHMHGKGIVHGDLRPGNILFVGMSDEVKVIDFGMAQQVVDGKSFSALVGRAAYVAPEVFAGNYGKPSDVWSLGTTAFVMIFQYDAFDVGVHENIEDAVSDIKQKVLGGFTPSVRNGFGAWFPKEIPSSAAAKDFIRMLLTYTPSERPQAHLALHHKWLSSLNKPEPARPEPRSEAQLKSGGAAVPLGVMSGQVVGQTQQLQDCNVSLASDNSGSVHVGVQSSSSNEKRCRCGQTAAKNCQNEMCSRCCEGTCERHNKTS